MKRKKLFSYSVCNKATTVIDKKIELKNATQKHFIILTDEHAHS